MINRTTKNKSARLTMTTVQIIMMTMITITVMILLIKVNENVMLSSFIKDAEALEVKANRKDLEESKHTCDELVFTSSQSEKEIPKTPKLRKQVTIPIIAALKKFLFFIISPLRGHMLFCF